MADNPITALNPSCGCHEI